MNEETSLQYEENESNAVPNHKEDELEKISEETGLTDLKSIEETNKSAMIKNKIGIYKNLAVVTIAFLLLFAAYSSLENLQSSLNVAEGLGTTGLTVVYLSKLVSSLFLPPFLFSKLGLKWTIVISVFGYIAYMAASFRATWATIIPTSVLLGVGASNLWTGQMAFVSELSEQYSNTNNKEFRDVLSKFFSIFYTVLHTGNIWGNLVSSLVFSYEKGNGTENISTCGISFCTQDESKNPNLLVEDPIKIYIYSGFCLGCGVIAVVLMALMLDNLKTTRVIKDSSLKILTVVVRQFWTSGYQKLLIPVTIYRGLVMGFIAGDFNAAYTSCSLGVENVGFVSICFAIGCSVSTIIFGKVTRMAGFHVPFIAVFVLHGAVGIVLFVWTPSIDTPYVVYICVGLWGFGYSVYAAILSPLYSHVFQDRRAAALSCLDLLNSAGAAISYGLSSFLCTYVKLILVMISLVISTACVLAVIFHDKYTRSLKSEKKKHHSYKAMNSELTNVLECLFCELILK